MPIALTFDTRDAVPEALKDHVAEREGKFIFEAEPLSVVADTNNKLKKLRADLDAKSNKLGRYAKFEELGDEFDAEEFLQLRELKKQGKPLTPDEKAEMERLHQKAVGKLTADLEAERTGKASLETQLKRYELTEPVRAIAVSEKVGMFPEDFDLAWSEIGGRFKLVKDDGKKPRIVVLDDDGDETDTKVEDFFTKLYQQQRPKFFKSNAKGGTGAQNTTNGGSGQPTMTRAQFDTLDQFGRMDAIKKKVKIVE